MKSKKLIYMMLSSALLLGSCDDFLDTMPDNRAEVNSIDKVTSLLVSAYPNHTSIMMTEMASDNAMDNGEKYSIWGEDQEDSYLWQDIKVSTSDSPKSFWDACYSAIAAANQALQAIDDMGNPEALQPQRGEALICRAYGHFALTTLFCMTYDPATAEKELGLPYALAPETSVSPYYTRGNLAEVYAKINDDIEEGLPLINDNIYKTPKYHFNRKAAYAFAARFNLYYLKFDKVIEYANEVLGTVPEKLLRNWQAQNVLPGFKERVNGYISSSENSNLLINCSYSQHGLIVGPYSIAERYGSAMELLKSELTWANGLWGARSNLYPAQSFYGIEQKPANAKYDQFFQYTDKVAGIGYRFAIPVLFTTDETLLCRAEAYALTNQPDKAVQDINTWLKTHAIRYTAVSKEDVIDFYSKIPETPSPVEDNKQRTVKKKLNPQGFTVTDGEMENLIHCILHLRRVETLHDGLRWYDVKRYGIEISHNKDGMEPEVLKMNDPRRAFQLPQDVINAGLQPNPRNN